MKLIDTHTHLFLPEFKDDRESVIKNAINIGVKEFYLPNIDSSSIKPLLQLTEEFPDHCFPMMGLHPTSVNENYKSELKLVEEWLPKRKFIAIGEIGIDLYWDKTHLKEQIIAFERQIQLSLDYNLPIVIHSRDSFNEIFEVLENFKNTPPFGIFHSFTGDNAIAEKAIGLGFKLGIGGIVTFKNGGLDKVVKNIDLKHLVLETDSPYLSPTPHRGKRNESSNLLLIVKKIAELHEVEIEEVAKKTTENALSVFK